MKFTSRKRLLITLTSVVILAISLILFFTLREKYIEKGEIAITSSSTTIKYTIRGKTYKGSQEKIVLPVREYEVTFSDKYFQPKSVKIIVSADKKNFYDIELDYLGGDRPLLDDRENDNLESILNKQSDKDSKEFASRLPVYSELPFSNEDFSLNYYFKNTEDILPVLKATLYTKGRSEVVTKNIFLTWLKAKQVNAADFEIEYFVINNDDLVDE